MKEVIPTELFYNSFRLYTPDKKCKECGQIVKSKRPGVRFYLIGITRTGMWRIKQSNLKTETSFHPKYFQEIIKD